MTTNKTTDATNPRRENKEGVLMAQDAREAQEAVRSQLLQLLLDKVEQDNYPSSTMLDLIEWIATAEDLQEYAAVLMAKIEDETYPSNALIRRLAALT